MTTVITANGVVQTHEEATVYANDLDLFVTVHILEGTSAVPSACEDRGYTYEWTSGQKPFVIKNVRQCIATRRITCLSLFQVCQLDLPDRLRVHPQHRWCRTKCEMIQRHVQQIHEVGANAVGHGETSGEIQKKPKTKNEDIDRAR